MALVPSSFLVTTSKALVTTSVALVPSSFLVTTSKALVTTSVALVPSSFLLLLVRHLLLLAWHLLLVVSALSGFGPEPAPEPVRLAPICQAFAMAEDL